MKLSLLKTWEAKKHQPIVKVAERGYYPPQYSVVRESHAANNRPEEQPW
jgi:hypothetical protein